MGRRIFVYDGRDFGDPDPTMSPDEVRQYYAALMPELSNANIKEEKQGEDTIYRLERRVGTKGGAR